MIPFQGSTSEGSILMKSPVLSGWSSLSICSNSATDSMQSCETLSKAAMSCGTTRVATGTFSSLDQESSVIEVRSLPVAVGASASNNWMR